jgi:protease YdgD
MRLTKKFLGNLPTLATTMVEFAEGQRAATPSFSRRVIFGCLAIAVPAFTYVGIELLDYPGSEPHREIVNINVYPWSSVGKVGAAGRHCTAAVIGPNEILTAAHCLYMISPIDRRSPSSERRFLPAAQIHFLLGYVKGEYRVHRIASRYTIPPTYTPPKIENGRVKIEAGNADWAVIYTDEPFPPDVRPLRLATATPSVGTTVKMGGYPAERPHMMTADPHCRIRAISDDGKLIEHDCVVHQGDSGGPLLSTDDEGLIFGVNVIGPSRRAALEDQSIKWGISVSAASISEFLASRVVSEIQGQKVSNY